jgi:FkbM family methyltransferase
MNIQKNKVLVQIGTNDGADEFNRICLTTEPAKVVLVEPNKMLNPYILHNYYSVLHLFLENVAITEEDKKEVELYLPQEFADPERVKQDPKWATGCFSLTVPTEYYGKPTTIGRTITAPGITFETLCRKHNLIDIHYLQIDTEGWDTRIIRTIDFDKHNIDIIQYESCVDWSNDPIVAYLQSKGYTLNKTGIELNVLAIKN